MVIMANSNSILFSSGFINVMYENALEDDDSINKTTFFEEQLQYIFNNYACSRSDFKLNRELVYKLFKLAYKMSHTHLIKSLLKYKKIHNYMLDIPVSYELGKNL